MTIEGRPSSSPDVESKRVTLTYHQTRYTKGELASSAVTGESVHEHFGNVGNVFCDDDSETIIIGNTAFALINQWSHGWFRGNVEEIHVTKNSVAVVDGLVGRAKVENGGKLYCTQEVEVPNTDEHGEIFSHHELTEEQKNFFNKKINRE